MKTYEELIEDLWKRGVIKRKNIKEAFLKANRRYFVLPYYKEFSGIDSPLPILKNQTISQPTTVATMTELLDPKKEDVVLEIGTGSGWQAAILSFLVKKVYTIEIHPELCEFAKQNLKKIGIKNVEIICGDGTKDIPNILFDKIIVTACTPQIYNIWIERLKNGGKLIAPVGNNMYMQTLLFLEKHNNKITKREMGYYAFVPLVRKNGSY